MGTRLAKQNLWWLCWEGKLGTRLGLCWYLFNYATNNKANPLVLYVYLFNSESIEKSLNLALESSLNSCGCCSCSCCLGAVAAEVAVAVGSIFNSLLRGLRRNLVLIWNLVGLWFALDWAWNIGVFAAVLSAKVVAGACDVAVVVATWTVLIGGQ